MLKKFFSLLLVSALMLCLASCGGEDDTYSFYEAASQNTSSGDTSSQSDDTSGSVTSENSSASESVNSSETVSEIKLEVSDAQLKKDKDAIQKTAQKAADAFFAGDIDGIRAAQPVLYDSLFENELSNALFSGLRQQLTDTLGDNASCEVSVTDISAANGSDIADMQALVDSLSAALTVETVRNVTFRADIIGSVSSEQPQEQDQEQEYPCFYANGTWYIAIFADMSALSGMDFSSMAGQLQTQSGGFTIPSFS